MDKLLYDTRSNLSKQSEKELKVLSRKEIKEILQEEKSAKMQAL